MDNTFIRVHHKGAPQDIDASKIVTMSWNEYNNATHLRFVNMPADFYLFVEESPDELLDLIDDMIAANKEL